MTLVVAPSPGGGFSTDTASFTRSKVTMVTVQLSWHGQQRMSLTLSQDTTDEFNVILRIMTPCKLEFKCKLILSNGTINKELCNWIEFISVALLKVWLQTVQWLNLFSLLLSTSDSALCIYIFIDLGLGNLLWFSNVQLGILSLLCVFCSKVIWRQTPLRCLTRLF